MGVNPSEPYTSIRDNKKSGGPDEAGKRPKPISKVPIARRPIIGGRPIGGRPIGARPIGVKPISRGPISEGSNGKNRKEPDRRKLDDTKLVYEKLAGSTKRSFDNTSLGALNRTLSASFKAQSNALTTFALALNICKFILKRSLTMANSTLLMIGRIHNEKMLIFV